MITSLDLLLILAVAIPCGAVGQLTSAYSSGGWWLHLGVASIGSFVGVWAARSFRLPTVYMLDIGPHGFPIIWAVIGSVFLVAAIGLIVKPRMR